MAARPAALRLAFGLGKKLAPGGSARLAGTCGSPRRGAMAEPPGGEPFTVQLGDATIRGTAWGYPRPPDLLHARPGRPGCGRRGPGAGAARTRVPGDHLRRPRRTGGPARAPRERRVPTPSTSAGLWPPAAGHTAS
jgi:hypothetical protein